MDALSDKELVARAVTGNDTKAFAELVKRHQAFVRNWLRQLSHDFSSADDIAQDTFVQAWNNIESFRGEAAFKSWLIKIAYTCFLQFKRKQKSMHNLLNKIDTLGNTEEQYFDNQALPDLEKLLAILNTEEKACMVLCYSHGYSHSEISVMINLPLGTVKSHIKRSTDKIRNQFQIEV